MASHSDGANKNAQDNYTLSGSGGKESAQVLNCKLCGETPPIKSNKGIAEELEWISNYLKPLAEPSCNGFIALKRSRNGWIEEQRCDHCGRDCFYYSFLAYEALLGSHISAISPFFMMRDDCP